jgi:hypothetical protein
MRFIYVDHMDQVLDAALVKRNPARRAGEGAAMRRERRPAARA